MQFGSVHPLRTLRSTWLKTAAFGLIIVAVGLPMNSLYSYALVAVSAVIIFVGQISRRPMAWACAMAMILIAAATSYYLPSPKFDEGHNVFLPRSAQNAILPPDVDQFLTAAFDAQYPIDRRCVPTSRGGCWFAATRPDRAYAFSADGIFDRSPLSRQSSSLDTSNPVWLGLGFINDVRYNWYNGESDVIRLTADRSWLGWLRLRTWRLTMPWYEVLQFSAAYAGSQLCWRGDVLWENERGAFDHLAHATDECRLVEQKDINRRIFGVSIKPDSLSMRLVPPTPVRLKHFASDAMRFVVAIAVIALLLTWRMRQLALPASLIAATLAAIALTEPSLIGGLRPMDAGNDGLYYDGVGRAIIQYILAGNFFDAFRGEEDTFYYGGPGFRYFRALEHVIFGETFLGYLTLLVAFPIAVQALFQRFVDVRWAALFTFVFVAFPVGALFGTTYYFYVRYAGSGFADPAAYIFFVCGLLPILGSTSAGPTERFAPAFAGGLLMALAIFMKPIIAPACAVMLAGAGLAAIYHKQFFRLAGLCMGFAPMLFMPWHNWFYGGIFLLFSGNASHPLVLTMPPSSYVSALKELVSFDFGGGQFKRGAMQIAGWLEGPSTYALLIPVDALGVAVTAYVAFRGRRFDPWLRLIAGAALAQHAVSLFYVADRRYHLLTWFLTLVVVNIWFVTAGLDWLRRRFPVLWTRAQNSRPVKLLSRGG